MSESGPPEPSVLAVGERAAVARTLRRENGDEHVIAEPSAEAGLRRLAGDEVDAVVSEYRLPGIDGVGFLRAVRAEFPRLPFVLSVADGSEELAAEAIEAGVSEYVPRGENRDALTRRLDAALDATDTGEASATTGTGADGDDVESPEAHATNEPIAAALRLKERAMDEAPVGITIADASEPDTPLVYVNDAFERITGYTREEALGRNCRFLQGERSDRESIAEMRAAIDEQRPTSVEILNYRKDGAPFWNEVDIAPISNDEGTVTHYVGFQTDVTDRKRAERDVERHADALDAERANLGRLLDRIEGLVRETMEALVAADTRETAEQAVVEEIVAAAPYSLAWIGDPDPTGETVVSRAWAGERGDELADGRFEPGAEIDLGADVPESSALARALAEGRRQIDTDPALPAIARTRSAAGSRRETTADRGGSIPLGDDDDHGGGNNGDGGRSHDPLDGIGTSAAIPISYRESLYGVLCVYTELETDIDERELAVLDALCNATATAINALESKRVLTAENVVKLDFEIADEAMFFAAISSRGACSLEHAGSIHAPDGSLCAFVTVTGAEPDRVREIARTCPEIDGSSLITEREDACLFEFTLADPTLPSVLADHGARIREITAEEGVCRLCIELPPDRDARSVAAVLEDRYGVAELVAYHERERPVRTESDFLAAVEDRLTDRQLTALRTAHMSGFFEWPRPVAGEELAASMDISRSTFHQHLRAAERKLAEVFFER
jgi:PAS domain S-box-containing protein